MAPFHGIRSIVISLGLALALCFLLAPAEGLADERTELLESPPLTPTCCDAHAPIVHPAVVPKNSDYLQDRWGTGDGFTRLGLETPLQGSLLVDREQDPRIRYDAPIASTVVHPENRRGDSIEGDGFAAQGLEDPLDGSLRITRKRGPRIRLDEPIVSFYSRIEPTPTYLEID